MKGLMDVTVLGFSQLVYLHVVRVSFGVTMVACVPGLA